MKTHHIPVAGYSVTADWYDGDAENILLTFTGWLGTRQKYQDLMTALTQQTGMAGLVFEYSGHGESPLDIQETRPAQHLLEAVCVFDWLKEHHPQARITVFGTSYGGFLAAQLVQFRDFDRLILRVPDIYQPTDFYTQHKNLDRAWTNTVFRKDEAKLGKLLKSAGTFKGKTLVIVHELDDVVPTETTNAYIKAFSADTLVAKGFPHSSSTVAKDQLHKYQNQISAWLNA